MRALEVMLVGIFLVAGMVFGLSGCSGNPSHQIELLNVSYDPTRELWRELNQKFVESYEQKTGVKVVIQQSHGGSSSQARSVIDGLPADVVTLALWPDTDALRLHGLLAAKWEERLPNQSTPYFSTLVFVVRQGNPKKLHDWADLAQPGVGVITPNPKTSGNGKLSFLAAWGAVRQQGGSETQAEEFVRKLYGNVLVLDNGARGATVTFAQRGIGDVHITWENEAHLEVDEAKGALEIVYPSKSIKAEPPVAWVDEVVQRKSTREVAEAYLRFLYTPAGQEIIAHHYYRPGNAEILAKYQDRFPNLDLFPVTSFVRDWDEAHSKFFAEGGVFDRIYSVRK